MLHIRCGSAEGLDAGRHCLKKWGFRRCEDICWIKTNKDANRKASTVRQYANSVLQHTKVRLWLLSGLPRLGLGFCVPDWLLLVSYSWFLEKPLGDRLTEFCELNVL